MKNAKFNKLLFLISLFSLGIPCLSSCGGNNNNPDVPPAPIIDDDDDDDDDDHGGGEEQETIPAEGISLDKNQISIEEGLNALLTCTITPSNATNKTITWKSGDDNVATVTRAGVVHGVSVGNTVITASHADGWVARCNVTVTEAQEIIDNSVTLSLDKHALSLIDGEETTLVATLTPDTLEDKTLSWNSTNPFVAIVNENGKVTATGAGTATIIVSHGSINDRCQVTVLEKETEFVDKGFVSIYNETVESYLSKETLKEQYEFLKENTNTRASDPENDHQDYVVSWDDDGSSSYRVVLSNNEDLSNPLFDDNVYGTSYNYGLYTPGETYYLLVSSEYDNALKAEKFTVNSNEVRFVNTPDAKNVRDFGGWNVGDDNINYKLMYRGGCLNGKGVGKLNDEGIDIFNNDLRIKTELDFRSFNSDSNGYQTQCFFNEDANYITIDFKDRRFEELIKDDSIKPVIKELFNVLAEEDNYPLYMHCNEGASRTGTAAFLIEAVLGVSYEDMVKDYELTNFSQSGSRRWRTHAYNNEDGFLDLTNLSYEDLKNTTPNAATGRQNCGYNIDALYVYLMENYKNSGSTIKDAATNYIKSCGVTDETINKFKEIMFTDNMYDEIISHENDDENMDLVFVTLEGIGDEDVIVPLQKGGKLDIATPVKSKMIFDGWYLGDTKFDTNTPINENITLTAHWKEYSDVPTDDKINILEMNKDLLSSLINGAGKTSVSGDTIECYELIKDNVTFNLPKIKFNDYRIVEFDYLNNWAKAHLSIGNDKNTVQFGQTNERFRYTIRIDCETGVTYLAKIVNFANGSTVSENVQEIGYTLNNAQLNGFEPLTLGYSWVSGTNKGFKLGNIITYVK